MPLKKSATEAAVSTNIREMVKAGHPQKQAVAAALDNQRRVKAGKGGGTPKRKAKVKGPAGGFRRNTWDDHDYS